MHARHARNIQAHQVVRPAKKEVDAAVGNVLAIADVELGHVGKHIDEVLYGFVCDSLAVCETDIAELLAMLEKFFELVVLHSAVRKVHGNEIA